MKKKIAVIGGSGFIGLNLCKRLSGLFIVINIDVKKSNIKNVEDKIVDIMNEKKLSKALIGCTYVFHLAGISDLNSAMTSPKKTAEKNIIGTINVLNACLNNNVKKLIYSSSIYSFTQEGGFYKCSKISAEFFIYEYKKRYNLNYTILRFGSIFGKFSNKENGLFRVMSEAIFTKSISYNGSRGIKRRFIDIQDVVIGMENAISRKYDNIILKLTGKKNLKITKVLNYIAKICSIKKKVVFTSRKNYPGHYITYPKIFKFPKIINLRLKNYTPIQESLLNLYHYILKKK